MTGVLPLLKRAKEALNTLSSTILAEIKGVKQNATPFMTCVVYGIGIILNGKVPKTWNDA